MRKNPLGVVQGTRDPLCPLDLLERVRGEMRAVNALHVVEGGDYGWRMGFQYGRKLIQRKMPVPNVTCLTLRS
jgi:fermentation-respiration switch protein FrsA (DUF1100 family)